MAAFSYVRGHSVVHGADGWRYVDTGELVGTGERACAECGLVPGQDGHDPCLGTLAGVTSACCGHGGRSPEFIVRRT